MWEPFCTWHGGQFVARPVVCGSGDGSRHRPLPSSCSPFPCSPRNTQNKKKRPSPTISSSSRARVICERALVSAVRPLSRSVPGNGLCLFVPPFAALLGLLRARRARLKGLHIQLRGTWMGAHPRGEGIVLFWMASPWLRALPKGCGTWDCKAMFLPLLVYLPSHSSRDAGTLFPPLVPSSNNQEERTDPLLQLLAKRGRKKVRIHAHKRKKDKKVPAERGKSCFSSSSDSTNFFFFSLSTELTLDSRESKWRSQRAR